jgi:hypothetical protein
MDDDEFIEWKIATGCSSFMLSFPNASTCFLNLSICHHLTSHPQHPASPPTSACSAPRPTPTCPRALPTCKKPTPSPFPMFSIVRIVKVRGLFDLSSRQNGNCISSKTLTHDRRPSQLSCGKDCNWRHVYPGQTLAFAAMLSFTQLHLTRVAEPSATKALDTSTLFAPTCATRTT